MNKDERGDLPPPEELLSALLQLEAALVPLSREPQHGWQERAKSDFQIAAAAIKRHCQAAEAPKGLLTQAERDAGRSRNVSTAHHQHEQLCERAQDLVLLLAQDVELDVVRELGAEIVTMLRRHLDLVGDLVYDAAFDPDTGVGD